MSGNQQLHAIVRGRVQGVYFRQTTYQVASNLGIKGKVRNLPDGTVEITAEAERGALDHLLDWARVGPPGARVDDVEVEWRAATGEFDGFYIVG